MLNIDIEYKKGVLFLRLDGVLNKSTLLIFKDIVYQIIEKAGIRYLLLNLEKLINIDNYGINIIIDTYKNYIGNNGKLLICGYEENNMINFNDNELKKYAFFIKNELHAFNYIGI